MSDSARWTRVLVEGAVIVASILVAFALDASWDTRNERVEAAELRAALVDDFTQTRIEMLRVRNRNEVVIGAADSVLTVLDEWPSSVSVPSRYFGALLLTPTTDPSLGTLQALISSARLRIIGDAALQGILSEWPAQLADVREEELAAKTFVHQQLTPGLGRAIDLSGAFSWRLSGERDSGLTEVSLTPSDLEAFRNLIRTRSYLASFVLEQALDEIEAELTR